MAKTINTSKEIILCDTPELRKRFWDKIDVKSDSECWEWQAARRPRGYGTFRVGRSMKATHRIAWIFTNGIIKNGLYVCHSCDNPPCCNPNHLFLGTQRDNMLDASRKKRFKNRIGEENAHAKLTENDIRNIRIIFQEEDISLAELGRRYGVAYQHIRGIVDRKHWAHVV